MPLGKWDVPCACTFCSSPLPAMLTPIHSSGVCLWVVLTNFPLPLALCWNTHSGVNGWVATSFCPSGGCCCSQPLGVCRAVLQSHQDGHIPLAAEKQRYETDVEIMVFSPSPFQTNRVTALSPKTQAETNFISIVSDFQDNHRNNVESLWRFKFTV